MAVKAGRPANPSVPRGCGADAAPACDDGNRQVKELRLARGLQSVVSGKNEMAASPLAESTTTLKVLAHPARLRLLGMLRSGGLCVCQAAAAMGSPFSTVSEHLGELKRAGLVVERREGRWVTYSLAATPEARVHLEHVFALIRGDAVIRQDERVARRVRRVPPAKLCDAGLDLTRFGLEPAAS
jgi:ArsR family transcriptional regulator